MYIKRKKWSAGFSLIEVLVSFTILSIVIVASSLVQSSNYKTTQNNRDRTFATQKAIQMLDEMRALVQGGKESDIEKLDSKDDKGKYFPILTTENLGDDLNLPAGATSGNMKMGSRWKYIRTIKVQRRDDDQRARTVYVSVYYSDEDGKPVQPALASLTALLRTGGTPNLPTQVMDAYALSIDNISGWWADVQPLKDVMDDTRDQLSLLNPGLDFRLHKVTKLAFGRDPFYAPFTNDANVTEAIDINYPYFYPGKVKNIYNGMNTTEYYFPANQMQDGGMRLLYDSPVTNYNGPLVNSWFDKNNNFNKKAYSAADMYNNGVRYPEEINTYNRLNKYNIASLNAAAVVTKDERELQLEPTLRILWEKMATTSDFKNALITNLHGESLPMLPIRNYSDAAKDPESHNYKRVVTHPENLEYVKNTLNEYPLVKLRVYPYLMKPGQTGNDTGNASLSIPASSMDKIPTTTVFIPTNQFVGAKLSDTQTDTDADLPNFQIPTGNTTVLDNIKKSLMITHIYGDSSTGYARASSDFTGTFTFTRPLTGTGSTGAIYIKAGTIIKNFITLGSVTNYFRTDSDVVIPNGSVLPVSVKASSIEMMKGSLTSASLVSAFIAQLATGVYSVDSSNPASQIVNVIGVAAPVSLVGSVFTGVGVTTGTVAGSGFALDNPILPANRKIDYSVEINPVFDRNGDGIKEHVPGILLTLRNTETKHLAAADNTGLASTRRLYGLEYIPTPLGAGMAAQTAKADTLTKAVTYPAMGTTYDTFSGRDLDSNLATSTKNTARWIISMNVNGGCNTTAPGDGIGLGCFVQPGTKMMAIETRMDNNLNSGMTINQTVNPYNGVVNSTSDFIINDPAPVSCSDCTAVLSDKDNAIDTLSNISRTYVWFGKTAPVTERYQLMGDPRHNPYLDVLQDRRVNNLFIDADIANNNGGTGASAIDTGNSWFPGFLKLNKYSGDAAEIDIPRYYQLFRESLANSNAIYNSLTGYSNWMFGIGGEISLNSGFNSQNFQFKGIPYGSTAQGQAWSGQVWSDATTGGNNSLRVIGRKDKNWVSLTWLGELYPDDMFTDTDVTKVTWRNFGNLTALGANASSFIRFKLSDTAGSIFTGINPNGTNTAIALQYKQGHVTGDNGSGLFFNGSTSLADRSKKFFHKTNVINVNLTSDLGVSIGTNYNLSMPSVITADREYSLSSSDGSPTMWDDILYKNVKTQITLLDGSNGAYVAAPTETPNDQNTFYVLKPISTNTDDRKIGSGMIRTELNYTPALPATQPDMFYTAMSGFQAPRSQGKGFIAKFAIAATIHTYLSTGDTIYKGDTDTSIKTNKSIQIPRVEFADKDTKLSSGDTYGKGDTPKEGSEITGSTARIEWLTRWLKWDGNKYTSSYPDLWREKNVTVKYQLLYSDNKGGSWSYINNDGSLGGSARPGFLSNAPNVVIECDETCMAGIATSTPAVKKHVDWNIAALPQQGSYLFRVEAYRKSNVTNEDIKLHYSYHQREIYVRK